jgi:hypothetical protein
MYRLDTIISDKKKMRISIFRKTRLLANSLKIELFFRLYPKIQKYIK